MESANTTPEHKKEFLNQVANEYGFFKKDREVFLARFGQENAASKNTEIANYLGMPHQEFQDYLREICDKLGFRSSGKGRSRKGESPWEKAFTWLWNEKFVEVRELEQPTANSEPERKLLIHRQVCQGMLAERRRLTTNPLTIGDGTSFERADVYVPLGLVERKRQAKRTGDDSPEQGSKLYEPTEYEVTRRFEHDEFFEQVLRQGLSPKSRGKRIAIIGEPGAGKTTLLQQIADWVFEDTDQDVAIWVSLADLHGRTLEEYLLNVWLKDALKRARVTPEMEDSLVELFNRGRVWLLLDGVDEMAMGTTTGGLPLQTIAKQLTVGWVSSARLVLTCRLNVWDAGTNALERFDTYRTLEFSYGNGKKPDSDQVNQFISKWFEPSEAQLGKALRTALDQQGKERIKDLVKNPLRLALMCYSWQRRQGELPKTKATLYQRFVEVFYEWKQEYFPSTSTTRQELNEALGRLAVEAMAQSSSRFRLTRRFVCEVLGSPDTPLFQLAIQLGWLNQVGVAEEDPDEPVYAFYHPTFQEYFAALAIDDWHYFLNHVPGNPGLGIYRIFEPQWKEVILLWLGREDVPTQDKEEFIRALVNFEDECWYFYRHRAYLLAAAGIAEFRDCSLRAEIVEQIVYWSFYKDELGIKKEPWWKFFCPVEVAREVLKESERETAIALLVELLESDEDIYIDIEEKALILGQIDPDHETAISILVEAIQLAWLDETIIDKDSLKEFADSLVEQFNPHPKLPSNYTLIFRRKKDLRCPILLSTKTLLAKASWTQSPFIDPDILKKRANRLSQVDPDNEAAIVFLTDLIQTYEDGDVVLQAAESLGQFDPGNQTAISFLLRLIQTYEDEDTRLLAASSLGKIAPGKTAITILVQLIHSIQDKYLRSQELLIKRYKETSSIDISDICRLQELCILAASNLGEIDSGNETAINTLVQLIHPTIEEYILVDEIRCQAAETLGKINPGNETAIAFLIDLIQTTEDADILFHAVGSLGEIGTGSETAIAFLIDLIPRTEDMDVCRLAAESLGKIAPGNEIAITALVELILMGWDEDEIAANSLKSILQRNQCLKVVAALKHYMAMTDRVDQFNTSFYSFYRSCQDIIWYCAQNMSYPEFYHAWHSEPSTRYHTP